jgi:DNA-directed RNA polymerase subunit RPC12/RpoP
MSSITLHDMAVSPQALIGVECAYCIRRALLTPEKLKAKRGDTRTLEEAGLYCSKCRSRRFAATRFHSRSDAHAFMRNL